MDHRPQVRHAPKDDETPPRPDRDAMLLRELRHRFRNNLQMLSGLLAMQAEAARSVEAREALEASCDRLQAMARLEDRVAEAVAVRRIPMDRYLRDLVEALRASYGRAEVELSVSSPAVALDADRALYCGLIVTELVTNSYKHAFPNGRAGSIAVAFAVRGDEYQLRVRDTGAGVPLEFTFERARSVGTQILTALARKLEGTYRVDRTAGLTVTLTFKACASP